MSVWKNYLELLKLAAQSPASSPLTKASEGENALNASYSSVSEESCKQTSSDLNSGTWLPKVNLQRRRLFVIGTLATAATGASTLRSASAAQAASHEKTSPPSYILNVEKGAAAGVATLDGQSKVPVAQIPDLSADYAIKNEVVFNVKNFGLVGDGFTDDHDALMKMIAALPHPPSTFGDVSNVIEFPAGRYILSGNYSIPERVTIRGAGPYQTILYRKSGAAGDFFTLRGANSVLRDLTLDGNNNAVGSGDNLVLDSPYVAVLNCTISNSAAAGITVGKSAAAIAYRLEGTLIRNSKSYGIRVTAGSGSTDGMLANCDVGPSGLSGVRIDNGSQNLVNVHVWGSGTQNADFTDGHGFYVNSASNSFTNCQAETNRAHGYYISGAPSIANTFSGCSSWGNVQNGIYILGAQRGIISGCKIYNNGVNNVAGTSSVVYAGIRNEGGQRWTITGNISYDNGASIRPGSYSKAPPYPYPGRTSNTFTMSSHYTETTGTGMPNFNAITGNNWPSEHTRSGVAVIALGLMSVWQGNHLGVFATQSIASEAAISPPAYCELVLVTGTASILDIGAQPSGKRLTLRFTDAKPGMLVSGRNLQLAGDFLPTQNATLSLISDGVNWIETGRSSKG